MLKRKYQVYIFRLVFPTRLMVQIKAFYALNMYHEIYLDWNINIPVSLNSQGVTMNWMQRVYYSIRKTKDIAGVYSNNII